MTTRFLSARALVTAASLATLVFAGAATGIAPQSAQAACGVKLVATNFDAPGDDNYMPQLNQEWVRIKNNCGSSMSIGGWKIHDYNTVHTYKFASGVSIGAGKSITLRSGTGSNTAKSRYWQRSYGAVWNNTGTEIAYLRNSAGTLMSSRTE